MRQKIDDPRRSARVIAHALGLTWSADPRGFLAAAGMQVLGALASVGFVVVGKVALESLLASGSSVSAGDLLPTFALLAFVSTLASAVGTFQTQQQRLLSERVSQVTWRDVLRVSTQVRLERYEMAEYYDHLQRVQNNAIGQPFIVTNSALGLIGGVSTSLGLLVFVFAIEPLLVPLLLLAGFPTLLWSRVASRLEFSFLAGVTATYRHRHYLRMLLTGRDQAKEIRAFGTDTVLRDRHEQRTQEYFTALRAQVRRRQQHGLGLVLFASVGLTATLGALLLFMSQGRVDLAGAGAAVLAIRMLSTRLDQIFRSVAALFESSLFLTDLHAFLGLVDDVEQPDAARALPTFHGHVALRDVTYTYPGSTDAVLRSIDLDIAAGQVVALVGENGSGKTTLAKVIAGLYRPTEGTVSWDGQDVTDVPAADLRRNVSVIFQDFLRYQLTALENIGLGDPEHLGDLDAARQAARASGAAPFIEALPAGYDTMLSKEYEGGTDLSGGQWQRVALARAIRRPARLVVLDEPSSALDPRTEHELFGDIRSLLAGRSVLLISHRFSTVRDADWIYVMHEGCIVESGDHASLMDAGGVYAELFELQTRAYL